jgi:hypothetical protein
MNAFFRTLLCTALLLLFAAAAHGDVIIYDFTQRVVDTLGSLGTKFIFGCVVIASAIVLAAFIKRKK